jgi:hypothetical protein
MSDQFSLPQDATTMPPLPTTGESGPQVCAVVQLYLAILYDLQPEQVQALLAHVSTCPECASVQHLMQQTTSLVSRLPDSSPSVRVDQAVMSAISARHSKPSPVGTQLGDVEDGRHPTVIGQARGREGKPVGVFASRKIRRPVSIALSVALLAAVLLLVLSATLHFPGGTTPSAQAFSLPKNLTWNGYVLYHSETRIDAQGERYRIDSYHDLVTGRIHVETIMDSSMDVVAIGDAQSMLGLDMMHHVAQWGASAWGVDETMFDLAQLRSDLATRQAVYLDTDTFYGQPVYRIRCSNGLVLLLDMRYEPVNVLRGALGPGTGDPIYDALTLMPSSQVSTSMWNMTVPPGFRMGTLPAKPE